MSIMVINRLMWIAIFISISSRGDMIDALTDVILGDGADMEIVVMVTPQITLEFVLGVAYAVGGLADLPDVKIIDVVSINMFPDENVHGLAAVITPVEFTLLSL